MISFAQAASSAARQVHAYLREYSQVAHLPVPTLANLESLYRVLLNSSAPTAHGQAAMRYLDYAAAAARSQWTQFKPSYIAAGLILLAAVAMLAVAALPVLLGCRTTLFTEATTLCRLFYLLPVCTVEAMRMPCCSAVMASITVAAARSFVPFSNSLVLGELQVVTVLAAVGLFVASGAALSRIVAVHTRVAETYYRLPSLAAPSTLARCLWVLVASALLPATTVQPPSTDTGATLEPPPLFLRGKRFRRAPTIIVLACMTLSLLLPWTFARIVATGMFAAFGAILMRMHWSFLDQPYSDQPDHSSVTSATQWQQLTLTATTRAVLLTIALSVGALSSCYALSCLGGIDRIGANPFVKAAATTSAPSTDATSMHPLAVAAPALVVTSILAAQIDRSARRVVRLPATVRRFGAHVPVWKVLGDSLLYLKQLGGVFAWLLPDRRLLLVLLELDSYDDELQQAEAHSHHMPNSVRALVLCSCVESLQNSSTLGELTFQTCIRRLRPASPAPTADNVLHTGRCR
jgi:hypothetical protein